MVRPQNADDDNLIDTIKTATGVLVRPQSADDDKYWGKIMQTNMRRYTFKLYPTPSQEKAMEFRRVAHQQLYNACLQQRIEAYTRCVDAVTGKGKGIGFFDQCKEVPALRAACPELTNISVCEIRGTMARIDDAYKAFFKRAKSGAGASSGFPKFKRAEDYPGWSYRDKSGWAVALDREGGKGRLYISGLLPDKDRCKVKFRGVLPPGQATPKSAEVLYRTGAWWLSLVVDIEARRIAGDAEGDVFFDLVTKFASVKKRDGGCPAVSEATVFTAADGKITLQFQGASATSVGDTPDLRGNDNKTLTRPCRQRVGDTPDLRSNDNCSWQSAPSHQQRMSRCKRGSNKYREAKRLHNLEMAKDARRRKHQLHNWTAAVIKEFASLTVEKPASVKEATASAKGNEREHGAKVAWKAQFNRRMLDFAPAEAVAQLKYKAEEAGVRVEFVDQKIAVAEIGNDVVSIAKASKKLKRMAKKKAAKAA